jgi:hypothetical protein
MTGSEVFHTVHIAQMLRLLGATCPLSYRGADKSLALPGTKQATTTEDFDVHILFIIMIGGILVLFIYITILVSKEIFSPSNKIHQK